MGQYKNHFQLTKWVISTVLVLLVNVCNAQTTTVSGIVMDASTKDPIPFASVYFKGGKGETADSTGHFEMTTSRIVNQLVVSYIGYKTKTVSI
ncbi:MAG TPA: carboxypeptidase-like regulatory domain-containing protein, partial [Pedobacter sp.]|nr:carboxypeptidase-like regulatory domain-containing protein [Pedobacter sp.]